MTAKPVSTARERGRALATGCAVALMGCLPVTVQAGGASAGFEVRIELRQSPGNTLCVSESVAAASQALVNVVCSTGQYVSIEPLPGTPFVGTHGGAFRYSFGPRSTWNMTPGAASGFSEVFTGVGTVTSMRIVRLGGAGLAENGPSSLEMLVSF